MKKKTKRNPSPNKLTPAKKKALALAGKKMKAAHDAMTPEEKDAWLRKIRSENAKELWARVDLNVLLGKQKAFSSPDDLWKKACEYFEFEKENSTFSKKEWKVINGKLKLVEIKLPNVFTVEGLSSYLSVTSSYFRTLQATIKQDDPDRAAYLTVIGQIKDIIYKNKFLGASNGAYNANFLAYDLGLRKDIQSQAAGMIINVENNDSAKMLDDVKRQLEKLDNE